MKKQTIKQVRAPVRIDFGGGTTDIYPFTHLYGGAVLNAAINKYVVGKIIKSNSEVGLQYHAIIPTSSGLGTSGAMSLVWLALISKAEKFTADEKRQLAEHVYLIEKTFGGANGKQDQYAAAFGGINFMEFHNDKVKITPIRLPKQTIRKLEDNLVLVYSGKEHFAADSNGNAIKNLIHGKNNNNLLRLKRIAEEMKEALLKRDLDSFASLLNKETEERKKLSKTTIPKNIRKMIDIGMRNGAIGAKVCGSGGGGSILFYGDRYSLKEKFRDKVIDFRFDFEGLKRI